MSRNTAYTTCPFSHCTRSRGSRAELLRGLVAHEYISVHPDTTRRKKLLAMYILRHDVTRHYNFVSLLGNIVYYREDPLR